MEREEGGEEEVEREEGGEEERRKVRGMLYMQMVRTHATSLLTTKALFN